MNDYNTSIVLFKSVASVTEESQPLNRLKCGVGYGRESTPESVEIVELVFRLLFGVHTTGDDVDRSSVADALVRSDGNDADSDAESRDNGGENEYPDWMQLPSSGVETDAELDVGEDEFDMDSNVTAVDEEDEHVVVVVVVDVVDRLVALMVSCWLVMNGWASASVGVIREAGSKHRQRMMKSSKTGSMFSVVSISSARLALPGILSRPFRSRTDRGEYGFGTTLLPSSL